MQTITFKIEEATYRALEAARVRFGLPSNHVTARQLLTAALSATGSDSATEIEIVYQELLALRADSIHITKELRELSALVRAQMRLQASLSELQLINIGNFDPQETQEVICALAESAFEE